MKEKKSIIFLLIGALVIVAFIIIGFVDFPNKGDNTESSQTEGVTNTEEDTSGDTETEMENIKEITLEEFFGDNVTDNEVLGDRFYSSALSWEIATTVQDKLYTRFGNMLYSCDLQGEQLSLVEKAQIPLNYRPFYDAVTETFYFVCRDIFTLEIYRMLEDGTIELAFEIEETSIHQSDPIIIEGGKCYYFTREGGFVLKAVDLMHPERKVEIYRWKEAVYGEFPYVESLQVDNRYIVVEFEMTSNYSGVSVYDKKDLKMIIDSDESMDMPCYSNGKLYYLNRENQQISVIEFDESAESKEFIYLAKVGSKFEMLLDNDYLYVRNYDYEEEECFIDIYTLERELVDTITLKDNADALDREMYSNPHVSRVLYTTENYVFIGEYSIPAPRGVFYFRKDKIGTEELTIYTLYLPKE